MQTLNPGALPPLASVTAVRVMNFSTYAFAKNRVSNFIQRMTGESPLEIYDQEGSSPTVSTVITFTAAGLFAGLVSSPVACKTRFIPYLEVRTDENRSL